MAKDLWDMTDDELEEAFRAAKAEVGDDINLDTVSGDEEEYVADGDNDEEIELTNLEQPSTDSDDDASSDGEDEDVTEEDSGAEDDDTDEDQSDEEEQTETETDESKTDEQPVNELEQFFNVQSKTRANGIDYTFSNKEKLEMFDKIFPQAADYTKKMQAIKPFRKRIDYMEQVNMTDSEFNFLMDLSKGDKAAITELIKRTGVDTLELDTENNNYVAKNYGRDDIELDIKEVVSVIKDDKEYTTTYNVLNSQWDDTSRAEFLKEPKKIAQLHQDVKDGLFDIINPMAQKLKVYDGNTKSDLDYYGIAADQYFANLDRQAAAARQAESARVQREAEQARINEVKSKQVQQKTIVKESNKRKAAAPSGKKTGTTKVTNYLDDLEENYDDWKARLDAGQ